MSRRDTSPQRSFLFFASFAHFAALCETGLSVPEVQPNPGRGGQCLPTQQLEGVIAAPSLVHREINPKHSDRFKPASIP